MPRFTQPIPFREALQSREIRSILPTELRTRMLSQLAPQIRNRSTFSAGVTKAELLEQADALIDDILTGRIGRAEARLELRAAAEKLGYGRRPELQALVEETGDEGLGGLTDLLSDRRLNVMLDTNTRMARGYGHHTQGQQPDVLDLWPAKELVRARIAQEPRDWDARFRDTAAATDPDALRVLEETGRMAARKDSPLWAALSAFGNPYSPYDFGSGMIDRDIRRDEAIDLGLIEPAEQVTPDDTDLNDDLRASPRLRSRRLRTALESTGLGSFDAEGVFRAT